MSTPSLFRRPSALLPIGMSLAALAVVIVHVVRFGTAREADEGAAAHIWQLLMVAQLPFIVFFALSALPRSPRQAWLILALQVVAALAAMAPVFLLRL